MYTTIAAALHRTRVGALGVLAVCTLLHVASTAEAQPSWPTTWISVGVCGESDPNTTTPDHLDPVGAAGLPAAYFAYDGDYAYFRERIRVDPSNGPGTYQNGAWVVLVKTATGDPFEYQNLIALDGNDDAVKLFANDPLTAEPISFSPIFNDEADTLLYSASSTTLSRSVPAGSSIGPGMPANYFVDWAIPRSVLSANGIDPTTSLYWFATSTNPNNYNKGAINCPFSPTTTMSLSKSASPASVSVGQVSPVTYTITVGNTGTYAANGIVLTDAGFPSWLTITNVTSTAGTVTFTSSNLEVRITSLPILGSATVTVTATANPLAITSFTNTATVTSINAAQVTASSLLSVAAPTSTPTQTLTPTITATATRTLTATQTPTASQTATPSTTPPATATATWTATATHTASVTATATATATPSSTSTGTATHTVTPSATVTATATASATPTATATATDTVTDTPTATATPTETGTATATATSSATQTATATVTETATPTATGTLPATATATATPTPYCGDGTIDAGEACDDGNGLDGDGCESTCAVSTTCGFSHTGTARFVGGCGAPNHPDIQSAIDAAADGDVITVCPGTYTQSVAVTRQVRIQATPGTATIHASGVAVDIRRSGVHIEGLTIRSDTAAAISADAICPLGQPSCPQPGRGSNVSIVGNTIAASVVGVAWQRRIDCAAITNNTMTGNAGHIELLQQAGPPAILVSIAANTVTGGGDRGAAISLSGLAAVVAANSIVQSSTAGLVLADMTGGGATQVVENAIADNLGDGITIETGAEDVLIRDNNITDNGVGLGNNTAAAVDARENWWDSQSGPSGVSWPNPELGPPLSGSGDGVVNRGGGTVSVVEFLCKPFPSGFPSVLGVCGTEVAELRQLVPGRRPDLDTFGRYIAFESSADLDVDSRTVQRNTDASQEIFLLNRRPKKSLTGVCLGGLLACDFGDLENCTPCNGRKQCPGDPSADPIVLNGECVVVTQLTNGGATATSSFPRIAGSAKGVVYATDSPQVDNADGSHEVVRWQRKVFEKGGAPLAAISDGGVGDVYDVPVPSLSLKQVVLESNANPTGGNPDGNTEIFLYAPRNGTWTQITATAAPIENRRPTTVKGKVIIFDSTGDLHNDPLFPGVDNLDGNRELFMARIRGSGITIRQITDTVAPAETLSGSMDSKGAVLVFSSTADLTGQNADGNREIFAWTRRSGAFEQVTISVGPGENANPSISITQRFVVFESTADLTGSGASNRRIFQFDRAKGTLTLLSRSRFGTNQSPRIRKRRFVVWESTSNLTGGNPGADWVVYLFDRKKD